jgi:peptidoglycan/LPS O-acetylase OafA/YrhL
LNASQGSERLQPISTTSASGREPRGRIDDIEVLRAFAVGLVLIHHLLGDLLPEWPQSKLLLRHLGFWSGVDLFLAISGFVIARSLLPQLAAATDRRSFVRATLSFWIRRAWRLLPSAWLWLAIAVTASAVYNRSGEFGPVQANVAAAIAAIFYYANIHFAAAFGRYPLGSVFHYWSLSLEEQFYIALPFVIYFARNRLSMVMVAIAASQFFIKRTGPWADLLFAHTRSDALCLGVLLAIWSQTAEHRRLEPTALASPWARWLLPCGSILALAMIAGPMFGYPRVTMGVLAVVGAGIVWIASYDRDYLFPPGRVKQALCWAGARSYALYLIHVPVYFATREFWFRTRPSVLQPSTAHLVVLVTGALAAVLVLAELNYRVVEAPLRRRGARIAERIRTRDPNAMTADRTRRAGPARANSGG